ncbi:hypothetical protein F5J12DRAFT_783842 [Pisolithus orientalis]|uniref:uncharacterized protein n=1 Tax=Pisolithus orientalis TaxID=936130 RepID=UPI002224036D|nr:uncharacterized protein F5J12DRAFT_783842 [Pisolithus orientalis]KAI6002361.1 hypothetical protein F5J12DRAFT_783842 [Pisolithus orientalis]
MSTTPLGSHKGAEDASLGGLVLFCLACPQPGINIPEEGVDYSHWTLSRSLVMDGNFKAEHMHPKDSGSEAHVNHANANWQQLASTGIGGNACVWHGCFVPHSMVNFQKGEQQVDMDYALAHAVWHGTVHGQQVIHFYDINCQYSKGLAQQAIALALKQKLKVAKESYSMAVGRFADLNGNVPLAISQSWAEEVEVALQNRLLRPQAMDIDEVQLQEEFVLSCNEAPSAKAIEIDLLSIPQPGQSEGMATWIAKALKIEEAQIQLSVVSWHITSSTMDAQILTIAHCQDQLQSHIYSILDTAERLFGDRFDDAELFHSSQPCKVENIQLPLPSNVGMDHFDQAGLGYVTGMELQLRQGQANDCLHELWLVLTEKAVIF